MSLTALVLVIIRMYVMHDHMEDAYYGSILDYNCNLKS